MSTIAATNAKASGVIAVTEVTLTGTADTFVYRSGVNQTLILRNATGGALTPIIDGNGGTTVAVDGIGVIDVSAGLAVGSIAAGAVKTIRTDSVYQYLQGTIGITGGTGLVATLLEY